jgi:tetratricopeptide (TPR) repeat protein
MDKNGQLTFSDDPLLNKKNESIQAMREGDFHFAVKLLDELLSINPEYPGLIESYRTAKFWMNRQKELHSLNEGKETAQFLMEEWEEFETYAQNKNMEESMAYQATMHFIFYRASENYKTAFQNNEDTSNNFNLLLNLGSCFLRLKEYSFTIDTLEYARSSYTTNAKLLFILAEAYYQNNEIPKSLTLFKEAFLIDPSELDLTHITSKPITDLVKLIKKQKQGIFDVREWIPVYAYIEDVFYVRKNINKHQGQTLNREIYNLEINFQRMNHEEIIESNILPRLINKYLWMLDYYEFQQYSFEDLAEIRDRLIRLDQQLFEEYFKNNSIRKEF